MNKYLEKVAAKEETNIEHAYRGAGILGASLLGGAAGNFVGSLPGRAISSLGKISKKPKLELIGREIKGIGKVLGTVQGATHTAATAADLSHMDKKASSRWKEEMSKHLNLIPGRGADITNEQLRQQHGFGTPSGHVATGDKEILHKGLWKGKQQLPTGKTHTTGDLLGETNVKQRLEASHTKFPINMTGPKSKGVFTGEHIGRKAGSKGIIGKALALAKKHPVAAAGIALGGGMALHKSMKKEDEGKYHYGYQ